DQGGDLVIHTAAGDVRQRAPHAYQQSGAGRIDVSAGYALRDDGTVGLSVGDYDRGRPLVIDPVLVYGTLFPGAQSIAVAPDGSLAVAGVLPGVGTLVVQLHAPTQQFSTTLLGGNAAGLVGVALDAADSTYVAVPIE